MPTGQPIFQGTAVDSSLSPTSSLDQHQSSCRNYFVTTFSYFQNRDHGATRQSLRFFRMQSRHLLAQLSQAFCAGRAAAYLYAAADYRLLGGRRFVSVAELSLNSH